MEKKVLKIALSFHKENLKANDLETVAKNIALFISQANNKKHVYVLKNDRIISDSTTPDLIQNDKVAELTQLLILNDPQYQKLKLSKKYTIGCDKSLVIDDDFLLESWEIYSKKYATFFNKIKRYWTLIFLLVLFLPVPDAIIAKGKIVPKHLSSLIFSTDGTVTKINKKNGNIVSKGEILFEIENKDLKFQLEEAEANVNSLVYRLDTGSGISSYDGSEGSDSLIIEAELIRATNELESLKKKSKNFEVIAKNEGILFFEKNIRLGDAVQYGEKFGHIGDQKSNELIITVSMLKGFDQGQARYFDNADYSTFITNVNQPAFYSKNTQEDGFVEYIISNEKINDFKKISDGKVILYKAKKPLLFMLFKPLYMEVRRWIG